MEKEKSNTGKRYSLKLNRRQLDVLSIALHESELIHTNNPLAKKASNVIKTIHKQLKKQNYFEESNGKKI